LQGLFYLNFMRFIPLLFLFIFHYSMLSQVPDSSSVKESTSYKKILNKALPLFKVDLENGSTVIFNKDQSDDVEVVSLNERLEIEKAFELDLPSSLHILQSGYKQNGKIVLFLTNHKIGKGFRYLLDLESENITLIDTVYDWSVIPASIDNFEDKDFTISDLSYKADRRYNRDIDLEGLFISSQYKNFHFFVTDLYSGAGSKEKHQVVALDAQFNFLWQRTMELDLNDGSFKLEDLLVDDLYGNLFIVGKELIDSKKNLSKIVAIKVSMENVIIKALDAEMHYRNGTTSTLNGNELVITSFYGYNTVEDYGGVVLEVLDHETLEVVLSNNVEIPHFIKDELKDLIPSMYEIGYNVSEARSEIKANDLFTDEEGSIYLIAEENRQKNIISTRTMGNPFNAWMPTSNGHSQNSLGSIIVLKLDPSGSLDYMKIIGKDQEGSKTDLFGVASVLVENKLFLYANGTEINQYAENPFKKLEYLELDRTSLYQFIIDEKGEFSYQKITDSKKDDTYLYYISQALKLDDNSLWATYRSKGKKRRVIMITHE